MKKTKTKKRVKIKREEVKPHLFDHDKQNQNGEKAEVSSAVGGMNMENFKKNLGCGS